MRDPRRPPPIPYFPDGSDELDAKATTPSNVATEILLVKIPPSSAVLITARITARNPANGNADGFTRVATFKRVAAGNVALVGAVAAVTTQQDDAGTVATMAASGTDVTAAAVVVTGLAGVPHNWNVNIRVEPVI